MKRRTRQVAAFGLLLMAVGSASRAADYYLFFTVSNPISPGQPSATVTMWAAFDSQWYAFCETHTQVWSDSDPGAFSDPVAYNQRFWCDPGDVAPDGDSITGIHLIQYQAIMGQVANTENPLKVWSATWTTGDFTPRQIPIWTVSTDYWVFVDGGGGAQDFYGPDFAEAQGRIEVVQACYPDFTGDGALDLFDFLAYVNLFNAEDPAADCTDDGVLDLFDFLCFVNAFNAGC